MKPPASTILVLLVPVLPTLAAAAEPGPWKLGTTATLTLSQSAFSTNWAGGDRGSIVWVLGTDSKAERQLAERFHWGNRLELAYGQTARQVPDSERGGRLVWDAPEKTSDRIAFESIGRWTLDAFADPYASLSLDTQFLDQSNPLDEIRFNPIKLKEAAGIARVLHRGDDAEAITRAGFGLRQTFGRTVILDPEPRRVRLSTTDGGLEWQTTASLPLLEKKVLWKGELLVFQALFDSRSAELEEFDRRVRAGDPSRPAEPDAEAVADFWRTPDVDLKNELTATITRSIGVSLSAQLVYDRLDSAALVDLGLPLAALVPEVRRNVRRAGQFREVLAVTVTYVVF